MTETKMSMLPTEQATLDDVALQGIERYENSILSNVPSGLADKGILAVRLFHYFLDDDTINGWTGKKTMLDIEESYIMSGIYPDEHLKKVYDVKIEERETKNRDGSITTDYVSVYIVLDKKEDFRIRVEAKKYWYDNGLDQYFYEATQYKRGNIPFADQLKFVIETDALKPGDVQNRKMAMDIYGMKNKNSKNTINVYVDGGGDKLVKGIASSSNNKMLDIGLDEEDDE